MNNSLSIRMSNLFTNGTILTHFSSASVESYRVHGDNLILASRQTIESTLAGGEDELIQATEAAWHRTVEQVRPRGTDVVREQTRSSSTSTSSRRR